MTDNIRRKIKIDGIVQGVGFRPFVFNAAQSLGLGGWVCNSSSGLFIEIEGPASKCDDLVCRLKNDPPALARIDDIHIEEAAVLGEKEFIIRSSVEDSGRTLISADMGICEECLKDIFDKSNRRYGYAFTNCTNCGPRFTIIKDIPYDREFTTMSKFPMCDLCLSEFSDPADRRFHAQPNACADCGPQLVCMDMQGNVLGGDPLLAASSAIAEGKIAAVKGIGGYHLVCDAANEHAVALLRSRKQRWDKPFAVMMRDMDTVHRFCICSDREEMQIKDRRRPIVLLEKSASADLLAEDLAPDNPRIGVMLPYTPLHYLLIKDFDVLVMTSANISDEPIVYKDEDVFDRLKGIADICLTHNREIYRRCDDSVVIYCHAAAAPVFVRRSRGYVPEPIETIGSQRNILAVGAEQKNTFCLTDANRAFLSQHIGELDNSAAFSEYKKQISDLEKMLDIAPSVIAGDMHPQYMSTLYAKKDRGDIPYIAVQHHHAHLASVLAENDIHEPVIGLIYDGTGYGEDGHMWGGEVLIGNISEYKRAAHLRYAPMPGGEKAIQQPWRMAMGFLLEMSGIDKLEQIAPSGLLKEQWQIAAKAAAAGLNAPLTSGMGRLFDGAAALMGIGHYVNYQGQAAVELEQLIDQGEKGSYSFCAEKNIEGEFIIDWQPCLEGLLKDISAGIPKSVMAARFHNGIIDLSCHICRSLRQETGINKAALSGGCWQNMYLLEGCYDALGKEGFEVLINRKVPTNDGGIAFGQAAVAASLIREGKIYVSGDTGEDN